MKPRKVFHRLALNIKITNLVFGVCVTVVLVEMFMDEDTAPTIATGASMAPLGSTIVAIVFALPIDAA